MCWSKSALLNAPIHITFAGMIIDLLFLIVAMYGLYLGYSRGIIKTVFTVLSYLFGVVAAFRFAPDMTDFLESAFDSTTPLMFIAGLLLTFVLTMIGIRMIAKFLENGLQTANINFINQAAGGILTAAAFTLLFSSMMVFADKSRLIEDETKRQSFTYAYLDRYPKAALALFQKSKPTLQRFWDRSMEFFDRLENYRVEDSESEPTIYDIKEDETTSTGQ